MSYVNIKTDEINFINNEIKRDSKVCGLTLCIKPSLIITIIPKVTKTIVQKNSR